MNDKFQIDIEEIDLDKWRPIGPDNIKINTRIIDDDDNIHEISDFAWPKSLAGLFWNLINDNVPIDDWGLSYRVSYFWKDKEKIKIKFFLYGDKICETTVLFIDFAQKMISLFDELIKLLDERSINQGYHEYKKDINRKLTLKYRSRIIEKVTEWKNIDPEMV